jgi:Protein of unknown function (DUF2490)
MNISLLKILPAAIVSFIAAGSLSAQDVYFPGVVPFISLAAGLSEKVDINVVAISKIRLGDHMTGSVKYPAGPTQFYGHTILSYKLTTHWLIGGGVGFQRNNPFLSNWRNDYRLMEQVGYNLSGKKWKFNNRLKIEERWFNYPDAPANFGTRVRYQPTFMHQLKGWKIYWEAYDELYAIPSGPRNSFISENWFYTGIGFTTGSSSRLDTGFGCNSVVMNTHHDLNTLLMLQVMWNYTIPSKHKKEIGPVIHSR